MNTLIICIAGLAVSTLLGGFIGLFVKNDNHEQYRLVLAFSVGIMLYASFSSLIIPSVNHADLYKFISSLLGLVFGVFFISLIETAPEFLKKYVKSNSNDAIDATLIFITIVAAHKLPEGLASGLALSSSLEAGIPLTVGIALQNIPDGLIVSAPLVASGVPKTKALSIVFVTALISAIGTLIGYFGVNLLKNTDCFSLSFAGAMLLTVSFAIIDEIKFNKSANYGITLGILLMIIFERII